MLFRPAAAAVLCRRAVVQRRVPGQRRRWRRRSAHVGADPLHRERDCRVQVRHVRRRAESHRRSRHVLALLWVRAAADVQRRHHVSDATHVGVPEQQSELCDVERRAPRDADRDRVPEHVSDRAVPAAVVCSIVAVAAANDDIGVDWFDPGLRNSLVVLIAAVHICP